MFESDTLLSLLIHFIQKFFRLLIYWYSTTIIGILWWRNICLYSEWALTGHAFSWVRLFTALFFDKNTIQEEGMDRNSYSFTVKILFYSQEESVVIIVMILVKRVKGMNDTKQQKQTRIKAFQWKEVRLFWRKVWKKQSRYTTRKSPQKGLVWWMGCKACWTLDWHLLSCGRFVALQSFDTAQYGVSNVWMETPRSH